MLAVAQLVVPEVCLAEQAEALQPEPVQQLLALLKAADTGENFWWILGAALLVFCIVQAIQDAIIVPKVMGKITGLNPAIILLSLSIWGALMGMLGMIIALPCTTIILSYYKRFIQKQEENSIKSA